MGARILGLLIITTKSIDHLIKFGHRLISTNIDYRFSPNWGSRLVTKGLLSGSLKNVHILLVLPLSSCCVCTWAKRKAVNFVHYLKFSRASMFSM